MSAAVALYSPPIPKQNHRRATLTRANDPELDLRTLQAACEYAVQDGTPYRWAVMHRLPNGHLVQQPEKFNQVTLPMFRFNMLDMAVLVLQTVRRYDPDFVLVQVMP